MCKTAIHSAPFGLYSLYKRGPNGRRLAHLEMRNGHCLALQAGRLSIAGETMVYSNKGIGLYSGPNREYRQHRLVADRLRPRLQPFKQALGWRTSLCETR